MSRRLATSFALSCALVCLQVSAADPMSRTWSDTTGRFKIKGTFVSLENDVVTILKEDGKEVEIPLRKLGPADQALAKAAAESAAENPFKEKGEESPFQEKGASGGEMKAPSETADAESLKTGPVAVDWNAATAVDPQPEHSNWSEAIKPEQLAEGASALKPKTIRLPNRTEFFESAKAVAFGGDGSKAAVGYLNAPPGKPATTRLVLVDTKTGKSLGGAQVAGEFTPVGLSVDGRRLLAREAKFGPGGAGTLEVWGLGKSGIVRGQSWFPHEDEQFPPHRDIGWATLTSDGRALSIGGAAGRLACWDLDDVAPAWFLDTGHNQTPALSPNGKYLAYGTKDAVGLLDVAAGKVLATIPVESSSIDSLAFSPDGNFLAATDRTTLWILDAATGALHREVHVQGLSPSGSMAWGDSEHVLLGGFHGPTAVHVESRIPVWQYTGGEAFAVAGGVGWFLLSERTGDALVGSQLPHAAAKLALQAAMADPNFFLLKPGATVALDLSGIPDADRPGVTESVRKSVLAAGFKIAGSAPVTVKASMRRGENREVRYHRFGSFNDETYNVQEYVLEFALVSGGKEAWKTSTSHLPAPGFVSLKQGQTMADLLKEHDKPGYEFFRRVKLPKFVPRPSETAALGSSEVAMQGVR